MSTNLLHFLCYPEGEKEKDQAITISNHACVMIFCERYNIDKSNITEDILISNMFISSLKKYRSILKFELLSRYGTFEPRTFTIDTILESDIIPKINPKLTKYFKGKNSQ